MATASSSWGVMRRRWKLSSKQRVRVCRGKLVSWEGVVGRALQTTIMSRNTSLLQAEKRCAISLLPNTIVLTIGRTTSRPRTAKPRQDESTALGPRQTSTSRAHSSSVIAPVQPTSRSSGTSSQHARTNPRRQRRRVVKSPSWNIRYKHIFIFLAWQRRRRRNDLQNYITCVYSKTAIT